MRIARRPTSLLVLLPWLAVAAFSCTNDPGAVPDGGTCGMDTTPIYNDAIFVEGGTTSNGLAAVRLELYEGGGCSNSGPSDTVTVVFSTDPVGVSALEGDQLESLSGNNGTDHSWPDQDVMATVEGGSTNRTLAFTSDQGDATMECVASGGELECT